MLGRKYQIEINDEGVSRVEAAGIDYIELNYSEIESFRQELTILKDRYMDVHYSRALNDGQAIRDVITPKIIKYYDNDYPFTSQLLVPWVSISSAPSEYMLTMKAYKNTEDSYSFSSDFGGKTSKQIMCFTSVDELQCLIDALDNAYSTALPSIHYSNYQRFDMGIGISVNIRSWGMDLYLLQYYMNVMLGYGQQHENYKDYLDMDFVNTWGDYVEKKYSNLAGCLNIGMLGQKRAFIYKAGIGLGVVQEYLQINEGAVSIFPGGVYTILGDSSYFPNLNIGIGYQIPQPSKFFFMINSNINEKYSDIGILCGYGF